MNQKRQFISDQYHFISEMIIISILMLLPIHFYYDWIPIWSTLIVAVPLCVVYTLLETRSVDYKVYYAIVPFLIITFLLLGFPFLISLPLSVVIIWRYLRIRQHYLRGLEASNILLTAMLSVLVYFITDELVAIGYLFLQLFVLVFGFMFSHVAVMEKTKRTLSIYKNGIYFILFLCVGALIAFLLSTQSYMERALNNFIYFIFSTLGRVVNLFDFLEPSDFEKIIEGLENLPEQPDLVEMQGMGVIGTAIGLYVAIGLAIAIVGIIVVLKVLKKDASTQEEINGKMVDLGVVSADFNSYEKIIKRFKKWRIGKKHPVRMMVHDFERRATKNKIGRRKSETLDEWFSRIGLQINADVYQKVRYGNLNVSNQEVETLRIGLEEFNNALRKKGKPTV